MYSRSHTIQLSLRQGCDIPDLVMQSCPEISEDILKVFWTNFCSQSQDVFCQKKHLFQNFSLENLQEWTWGSWDDFGAVWFVDFSCWPLLSLLIKFGSGIRQTKNACCRGVEILLVSSWYNFDTHESSDVLTPMVRTDSIVAFSYALISDHKVN